jgi:hypothetical protein
LLSKITGIDISKACIGETKGFNILQQNFERRNIWHIDIAGTGEPLQVHNN